MENLAGNHEFHGVFQSTPMIAFKRSKNVQEIIGGHTVKQETGSICLVV